MELTFRKAVPDDAPAMAHLLTVAWQKAYRGILSDALLDGIDEDERCGRIRSIIGQNPAFQYYILETDGEMTGVSGVGACRDEDLPNAAEIVVFYIHPDDQGQGLGKNLMRDTLAAIRESGSAHVALWVLRDNHNALAFYEKAGFAADGAEKTLPELENAVAVRYRYAE
ncbi:MAG: GNAT family N-acetyltransferase [Bacillota bacterium]